MGWRSVTHLLCMSKWAKNMNMFFFDKKPERLCKVERMCLSHWGTKIVSAGGEGDDTLN